MAFDLFAGARVRDYDAAKSWYERLLGREPAFSPHATEAVWELAEHRYLFIDEDRDAPGGATITIFVDDLDALAAEIASRRRPPACKFGPRAVSVLAYLTESSASMRSSSPS